MSDNLDSLKELDDLEFEIMFIDNIYKKLKSLDKPDMRTETLLFMYMSVTEALKKYKAMAQELEKSVPHEDVVDVIVSKCEGFLRTVANDETKVPYTQQSLSAVRELTKELLFVLKKELLEKPKYTHLKKT